jgi:hypothetical protein
MFVRLTSVYCIVCCSGAGTCAVTLNTSRYESTSLNLVIITGYSGCGFPQSLPTNTRVVLVSYRLFHSCCVR